LRDPEGRVSFALDLQRFAEKTKDKADLAVGKVVMEVSREIDQRSPVGDATYWKNPPPKGYVGGRFRGSWNLGVGLVPPNVETIDPSGAETQGRIIASIPEDAAGKVYYLVNQVPYARRIEDGWSRQAPQGVVGLTAIGWQAKVDAIVAELPA
jgi:hypothetical protein